MTYKKEYQQHVEIRGEDAITYDSWMCRIYRGFSVEEAIKKRPNSVKKRMLDQAREKHKKKHPNDYVSRESMRVRLKKYSTQEAINMSRYDLACYERKQRKQ